MSLPDRKIPTMKVPRLKPGVGEAAVLRGLTLCGSFQALMEAVRWLMSDADAESIDEDAVDEEKKDEVEENHERSTSEAKARKLMDPVGAVREQMKWIASMPFLRKVQVTTRMAMRARTVTRQVRG